MKPSKHLKTIKKLQADLLEVKNSLGYEKQRRDRDLADYSKAMAEKDARFKEAQLNNQNLQFFDKAQIVSLKAENARLWYILRLHAGDQTLSLRANDSGALQNVSTFPDFLNDNQY